MVFGITLGNDIVDMNDARNHSRHADTRFVNKIFTKTEQQQISASDMPDYMVWVLWAAKESAYKIINKRTGKRSYAPFLLEVEMKDVMIAPYLQKESKNIENKDRLDKRRILEGIVSAPDFKIHVQILVTPRFIYCTGCSDISSIKKIEWGIENNSFVSDNDQSLLIRRSAEKHIARSVGKNIEDIRITRDIVEEKPGPPLVYINNEKSKAIDLTLTHDGPYSAYAFIKQQSNFPK